MTKKAYRVYLNGQDLGAYAAENSAAALDACARDAGYKDWRDACEQTSAQTDDVRIIAVEDEFVKFPVYGVDRYDNERNKIITYTSFSRNFFSFDLPYIIGYAWIPEKFKPELCETGSGEMMVFVNGRSTGGIAARDAKDGILAHEVQGAFYRGLKEWIDADLLESEESKKA